MGDDRRHLPTFAIERKDDDDDDRERRGFYSFSAAFLFNQSRQLRDVAKKNARRRRRRLRQTFRREKETKRSREISVPQHPKERKKENDGRTDKSTRSRDAYLELRFRPVRLGPVDPAERVLFARGVRSRRVFGGRGHFDNTCSGK